MFLLMFQEQIPAVFCGAAIRIAMVAVIQTKPGTGINDILVGIAVNHYLSPYLTFHCTVQVVDHSILCRLAVTENLFNIRITEPPGTTLLYVFRVPGAGYRFRGREYTYFGVGGYKHTVFFNVHGSRTGRHNHMLFCRQRNSICC